MESLLKCEKLNKNAAALIVLSSIGRIILFFPSGGYEASKGKLILCLCLFAVSTVLGLLFWSRAVKADKKSLILLVAFVSDQLLFSSTKDKCLIMISLLFVFLLVLQSEKRAISVFVLPIIVFACTMIQFTSVFDYIPLMIMAFCLCNRNGSRMVCTLSVATSIGAIVCVAKLLEKKGSNNAFLHISIINDSIKTEYAVCYAICVSIALLAVFAITIVYTKHFLDDKKMTERLGKSLSKSNKNRVKRLNGIRKYVLLNTADMLSAFVIVITLNSYGFYRYFSFVSPFSYLGAILFIWALVINNDTFSNEAFEFIFENFKKYKTALIIAFVAYEIFTTVFMIRFNCQNTFLILQTVTDYM